jgi:hypothetical protein
VARCGGFFYVAQRQAQVMLAVYVLQDGGLVADVAAQVLYLLFDCVIH